jgi:hypothetical protein
MFEDSELNVDGCSQSMMILVALAGFVVVLVLIGRFWSQRRGIGLLGDPVGAQAGRSIVAESGC